MSRRRAIIMPLAVALAGLCGALVPAAPGQAATYTGAGACTTTSVGSICLNDPLAASGTAARNAIITALTNKVAATTSGTIRILMYRWDAPTATTGDDGALHAFNQALVAAQTRGVTLDLVVDGSNPANKALQDLFHDSLKVCSASNCLIGPDGTIMHNKLFQFTTGSSTTTMLSSVNLNAAMMSKHAHMVVMNNTLAGFYTNYFTRVKANDWDGWTTAQKRIVADATGTYEGIVYPQLATHDDIAALLNSITYCNDTANVRIASGALAQSRLTAQSNKLLDAISHARSEGCKVQVLVESPDAAAVTSLKNLGVKVRQYNSAPLTHFRSVQVYAKGSDAIGSGDLAWRHYTYTGTSKALDNGVWKDPNAAVLTSDPAVYTPVYNQFQYLWSKATEL